MPYIKKDDRYRIEGQLYDLVEAMRFNDVGMVNFVITTLIKELMPLDSYSSINEAVGVLECAKLEFYRRIAVLYEDKKISENGDVY